MDSGYRQEKACSGNDGLPKIVIYRYSPTRESTNAVKLLAGFEGTYLNL